MKRRPAARRHHVIEALEPRLVLTISFDSLTGDALVAAEARGGGGGGGGVTTSGPEIRLDLVALHELGHALGLSHSKDPNSVMYAYYNANYDINNFASDSILPTLRSLYANVNDGKGWDDSLDPNPGNGVVDLTFSFMPDGAKMDKSTNTLFATFNAIFGSPSVWEAVFIADLNLWASVSGPDADHPHLSFTEQSDSGLAFNYSGLGQDDPRAGDIRIGSHRFDGAGKVLAHTYYPPPNGSTAAGDAHFDNSENWVLASAANSTTSGNSSTGQGGLTSKLWFAASTEELQAVVINIASTSATNDRTTFVVRAPQVTTDPALLSDDTTTLADDSELSFDVADSDSVAEDSPSIDSMDEVFASGELPQLLVQLEA